MQLMDNENKHWVRIVLSTPIALSRHAGVSGGERLVVAWKAVIRIKVRAGRRTCLSSSQVMVRVAPPLWETPRS